MANPVPGTVVPTGALVSPGGAQGTSGPLGGTGPAGPTAVSADAGNIARLGSDSLIYVPPIVLGGYLQYVSLTQLSFTPFRGNKIVINGRVYQIPNAGIVGLTTTNAVIDGVAGQSLAVNTLYYVYCFNNGGTLTAEFSVTGHLTSTTAGNEGTETKTGDDSRTFIGLILTGATLGFYDQANARYVRSWFNKGRISFFATGGGTTAATAATALINLTVLNFDNEQVDMHTSGYVSNNATVTCFIRNGVNGAQIGIASASNSGSTNFPIPHGIAFASPVNEGKLLLTSYGYVASASTMTYSLSLSGTVS